MTRKNRTKPTAARATPDDRWAEWDRFVAAHPHGGFMQCSAWIRCRSADGYDHLAVILRDDTGRIAGGAVVGRWDCGDEQAFYYIQDGPLLPEDPDLAQAVFAALLARLEQHRRDDPAAVSHLRIEPRCQPADWPDFARAGFEPPPHDDRYREPRDTSVVDLRASEDERLAAMRPKGRYNVRLARRHGVTVVEAGGARALEDFLAIRDDTARRQGLGPRPKRHFADLLHAFGPHARLYFAELDGRRLATALVLQFAHRATYFYGGSLVERRDVMAPYLLHHEIMNRHAALGDTAYDLWGISPAGQPGHELASISEFKRKFGGAEIDFVPTLDRVYDPQAYARFFEREAGRANHAHGPAQPAAAPQP